MRCSASTPVHERARKVTAEEFRRHLDALRVDYRARLPAKVSAICQLWRDATGGALPAAVLDDLRRELHTLAGSATTFGVAQVSALAGAAESVLDPFCERRVMPDAASAAELSGLLDALQRICRES